MHSILYYRFSGCPKGSIVTFDKDSRSRCGFALIVTLILNSMITFFTQPMPPKALCSRPSTGKNEYLTILGNY